MLHSDTILRTTGGQAIAWQALRVTRIGPGYGTPEKNAENGIRAERTDNVVAIFEFLEKSPEQSANQRSVFCLVPKRVVRVVLVRNQNVFPQPVAQEVHHVQ